MELKHYWSVVRKRLWLILVLVAASGAATGFYSYSVADKQYMASTKLLVNASQQVNVVRGTVDLGAINSSIQLAKTYKEIIRTPRIMKLVEQQHPELGLSANRLIGMVSVSTVGETQVMSIHAVDVSYKRAAEVANAVAHVFRSEIPNLMKIDNVDILNEADPNAAAAPISPQPVMNVAVSVALSAMLGLGLVLLLDYLDDTFKSQKDVEEALGLPTFAVIPRIRKGADARGRKVKPAIRSGENAAL